MKTTLQDPNPVEGNENALLAETLPRGRFLLALLCLVEERGGATQISQDTIDRTWSRVQRVSKGEPIDVGMQPVPGGILVVNLFGAEMCKAWDTGTLHEYMAKEGEDNGQAPM